MIYYIAVFQSRAETLKFQRALSAAGLTSTIVNTPREASLGCGLSVRFNEQDLMRVRRLYTSRQGSTFAGFYRVVRTNTGNTVTRI